VGTRNSQKKSPRSSTKSKQDTTGTPETSRRYQRPFDDLDDEEMYMSRSVDHVARVRAAKEAAQREMESFGDVSEYDITIIQGQLQEETNAASQASLDFQSDATSDRLEKV
jgi:hypothetical protein